MVAVLIIGYGVSSNAYVCIPYYAPLSFQVTDADQKISVSTETLLGLKPGKTRQLLLTAAKTAHQAQRENNTSDDRVTRLPTVTNMAVQAQITG
tara:strand:- start:118 stop:399 length:282 start_codon:yes stop_codon:yes gene_type:complete